MDKIIKNIRDCLKKLVYLKMEVEYIYFFLKIIFLKKLKYFGMCIYIFECFILLISF